MSSTFIQRAQNTLVSWPERDFSFFEVWARGPPHSDPRQTTTTPVHSCENAFPSHLRRLLAYGDGSGAANLLRCDTKAITTVNLAGMKPSNDLPRQSTFKVFVRVFCIDNRAQVPLPLLSSTFPSVYVNINHIFSANVIVPDGFCNCVVPWADVSQGGVGAQPAWGFSFWQTKRNGSLENNCFPT